MPPTPTGVAHGLIDIGATGSDYGRTLSDRFGESPHVEDWRYTSGGVLRNDAQTIQAAFTALAQGGPLRFGAQEYLLTTMVTYPSNIQMLGVPGRTILKTAPSFPDGFAMLRPLVFSGTAGEYVTNPQYKNRNVTIDGIIFDGNNRTLTGTVKELVSLWSIDGLRVSRCVFRNHPYILVALGGVRNAHIDASNEFTNWGRPVVNAGTPEGGAAIWSAPNPIDGAMCTNVILDGDYHDAEWTSIYAFGRGYEVLGWHRNVKEAAIYTRTEDSGYVFEDSVIRPRLIDGVARKYIAAAGMEIGGKKITIYADNVKNCGAAAVDITNVCDEIMVHLGSIENCCKDDTYAGFANMGQVVVRSVSYTTPDPTNITIMGGRIKDTQTPKKAPAGVKILEDATVEALPVDGLTIVGVDVRNSCILAANAIKWDAGAKGIDWIIEDNLGFNMPSESWTPTYTASVGTLTTITTNTAKYKKRNGVVDFTLALTVTDNGTGSGVFRFTLPSTPLHFGALVGVRANTLTALIANVTATSPTVDLTLTNATYPVATGSIIKVTGQYFES